MECDQIIKVRAVALKALPMLIHPPLIIETEPVPQDWKAFRSAELHETGYGARR